MANSGYNNATHQNLELGTMEQENDPLLLEENTGDTHHTKTDNQFDKPSRTITKYLTNTLSSWKQTLFGLQNSRTAASQESRAKLMEHMESDIVDDSDGSVYGDDHWYTATTTTTTRRKRCLRLALWSLCVCIGVPLGLLLLLFIGYALTFRPPPVSAPAGSIVALERTNLTQPARLLTYNIFMRPPGVKNNENDYKNERLEHIIKTILPRYDIITFQEAFAFGNHRVDQLIVAAQQLGFGYIMSPRHGPWELAADGGLLFLSRFPILQVDILEYPRGLHSDWLSKKGALHALVGLDRRTSLEQQSQQEEEYQTMVHIFTTHTQASYGKGGTRTQKDILMRLDQFARLHQFIYDTVTNVAYGTDSSGHTGNDGSNAKNKNIPIIAMGDFNIDSVDHSSGSITDLPVNSSIAYTMMMDVLEGNGIDGSYFSTDSNDVFTTADGKQQKWFKHDWHLPLTDMAYKTFGYHPVTFGGYVKAANGTLLPAETTLTHSEQVLTVQSIDQLLYSPSPNPSTNLSMTNITIEKFLIAGEPYTQLSDHYGLGCLLSL